MLNESRPTSKLEKRNTTSSKPKYQQPTSRWFPQGCAEGGIQAMVGKAAIVGNHAGPQGKTSWQGLENSSRGRFGTASNGSARQGRLGEGL